MARVVLIAPDQSSGDLLVARRARLRDRLAARWRATSLDSELARGVAPEARATLALRAERLGDARSRKSLARSLRRVLDDARGTRRPARGEVPTRRAEVLAAAEELDALARRLLSPGIVAAYGLAQVRLLLVDGRSPLYFQDAADDLRGAISRALAGLQPTFAS